MAFKSAAETLMERVVKNFELKDVIAPRFIAHKNLFEVCAQYPSQGRYFTILRIILRDWVQSLEKNLAKGDLLHH